MILIYSMLRNIDFIFQYHLQIARNSDVIQMRRFPIYFRYRNQITISVSQRWEIVNNPLDTAYILYIVGFRPYKFHQLCPQQQTLLMSRLHDSTTAMYTTAGSLGEAAVVWWGSLSLLVLHRGPHHRTLASSTGPMVIWLQFSPVFSHSAEDCKVLGLRCSS